MWAVTEANLCTMEALKTTLTIDDYISAWEYLMAKNEAILQAQERARSETQLENMARSGQRGGS